MSLELKEASARLDALEQERFQVQNNLARAVEEGDADSIIELERRASEIEVQLFASRAKILKLRRSEVERQRREAITQRELLDALLVEATKQFADAISVADERRVVMQTAQVQTFSCQSRIDQLREDYNGLNEELKILVSGRVNRGN